MAPTQVQTRLQATLAASSKPSRARRSVVVALPRGKPSKKTTGSKRKRTTKTPRQGGSSARASGGARREPEGKDDLDGDSGNDAPPPRRARVNDPNAGGEDPAPHVRQHARYDDGSDPDDGSDGDGDAGDNGSDGDGGAGDNSSDGDGDAGDNSSEGGIDAGDADSSSSEGSASDNADGDSGLAGLDALVARLPKGGRPSRKEIAVDKFSGRLQPGDFDSKVRTFWSEFHNQILGAQLRDGHRWVEQVKVSFLQACLTGDASKWFNRLWQKRPYLSLREAGAQLVAKYTTRIDEDEIRERIKMAKKQADESYEMYSQRLQDMADSLPGGVGKRTNARAALAAFVKTANPKRREQLEYWLLSNERKYKPLALLNQLVEVIGRLDRTDGVKISSEPTVKRTKVSSSQPQQALAAAATSTVVDRKRKPNRGGAKTPADTSSTCNSATPYVCPPWVGPKTKCYGCGGRGHLRLDPACPNYREKQPATTPLSAAATTATSEDSE